MKSHHLARVALAAWLIAECASVDAQVQRSGGGEAQKFMQQYQQLAAEKTALQTQLTQMKKDLDSAKADLVAMKKERDTLKAQKAHPAGVPAATVAQLTASKEAAERNVELSKQRMTELVTRFRETATSLKEAESDRTKLRGDLEARNAAFDQCAANNQQLYEINGQILQRYNRVGLFTRMGAVEPFTQITRNRIDNLVVETHARAEELRVKKSAP
jgi:chromosome segregation ATPase